MIKILKYKFSKKLLNSITLKMMQKILDTTNFFFFFHLLVCTSSHGNLVPVLSYYAIRTLVLVSIVIIKVCEDGIFFVLGFWFAKE